MMFQLVPFNEILKKHDPRDMFTESIQFKCIRDEDRLMEPLFEFLHKYNGVVISTYKSLYKYKNCTNHINQKNLNRPKKKVNDADEYSITSNNKTTHADLLRDKLDMDTLESFLSSVDNVALPSMHNA